MDDIRKTKCMVYSSLFSVAATYPHNVVTLLITQNDHLWPAFTEDLLELAVEVCPYWTVNANLPLLVLVLTFKDQ